MSEVPEEMICRACHEANRALTGYIGDVPVQPRWDDAPEEMKRSTLNGVRWRLANLDAPASAQHDEWMRSKLADGWKHGLMKDVEKKTHPALIPYNQLRDDVKLKDVVFAAIVRSLA